MYLTRSREVPVAQCVDETVDLLQRLGSQFAPAGLLGEHVVRLRHARQLFLLGWRGDNSCAKGALKIKFDETAQKRKK